ncbi:MAG: ABC transporter permease [Clostridium sp.]|jgi:binding protein-dependent transport system, inner membrane component|nr:ABC transporter permease [Clostridium sp.]PWM47492.1 MAG: glutathione ABC transporter permease GsiD [Clostridia bacterium]
MNYSPIREFFYNCRRNVNFVVGFLMILSLILVAIFAQQIAPYDYDEPHKQDRLQAPNSTYLFGTDDFGRDMFSKVIYGTRITLWVALLGTSIQLFLGVVIGLLCGYFGGWVDKVLLFITDVTWCVPGTILALAVVTVLGKGLTNSIIAISLVGWAGYARTVRAKTMSLRTMAFVETGRAFGESSLSLMFRYILPNIVPSLIVLISNNLPGTIMATTTLSFLGLGSQPPSPDWGLAISQGMNYVHRAQWLSIFPGLALVYTVLGFNILGEGMRDLLDPRLKGL